MSSMCVYQGLGQMLTKRLQHHQGCSETPKCAYVIYGQPLIAIHLVTLTVSPLVALAPDIPPESAGPLAAARAQAAGEAAP